MAVRPSRTIAWSSTISSLMGGDAFTDSSFLCKSGRHHRTHDRAPLLAASDLEASLQFLDLAGYRAQAKVGRILREAFFDVRRQADAVVLDCHGDLRRLEN